MRLFVTMVIGNHGHGPTMSLNVSRFKVDTVTCQVILCRKATHLSLRLNFISHWICTEICFDLVVSSPERMINKSGNTCISHLILLSLSVLSSKFDLES